MYYDRRRYFLSYQSILILTMMMTAIQIIGIDSKTFDFDWCDKSISEMLEPEMAKKITHRHYTDTECLFASSEASQPAFPINKGKNGRIFLKNQSMEFCKTYSAHLPTVRNKAKNDQLKHFCNISNNRYLPLGIQDVTRSNATLYGYTWDSGGSREFQPDMWATLWYAHGNVFSHVSINCRINTTTTSWWLFDEKLTEGTAALQISINHLFFCEQDRVFRTTTKPNTQIIISSGPATAATSSRFNTSSIINNDSSTSSPAESTKKTVVIENENTDIPDWVWALAGLGALLLLAVLVLMALAWRQRGTITKLVRQQPTPKTTTAANGKKHPFSHGHKQNPAAPKKSPSILDWPLPNSPIVGVGKNPTLAVPKTVMDPVIKSAAPIIQSAAPVIKSAAPAYIDIKLKPPKKQAPPTGRGGGIKRTAPRPPILKTKVGAVDRKKKLSIGAYLIDKFASLSSSSKTRAPTVKTLVSIKQPATARRSNFVTAAHHTPTLNKPTGCKVPTDVPGYIIMADGNANCTGQDGNSVKIDPKKVSTTTLKKKNDAAPPPQSNTSLKLMTKQ